MSEVKFPLTRGDCIDGPRPCPHSRCRHHLEELGKDRERRLSSRALAGVTETCALDVVDKFGGIDQREVAELLGTTQQSVSLTEQTVIRKLGRNKKMRGMK